MIEMFAAICIFILGAIVGSFLNVCIVRMPHEKSVIWPGSHCVSCKAVIAWYDNIPLISYWVLGGKCRACGEKFSVRYFCVELVTALAFLGLYHAFGLVPQTIAYCFVAGCFIVATFVDFEHRIIPDEISVGGMFAGLAFSFFIPALHDLTPTALWWGRLCMWVIVGGCLIAHFIEFMRNKHPLEKEDKVLLAVIAGLLSAQMLCMIFNYFGVFSGWLRAAGFSLEASLIGLLFGGGIIYAMGLIGDIIFRKESMGGGDVKLMALIGAFMGWKLAILTFFIAPFFGAFYGIAEKIRTKESAIAYGPFLVLGAIISLFYGDVIIQWLMGQYGIY